MHAHSIDIGPVEQGLIRIGFIGLDPLDQFELADKLLSLGGLVCRPCRRR
jgi:hypothetical protein